MFGYCYVFVGLVGDYVLVVGLVVKGYLVVVKLFDDCFYCFGLFW